MTGSLPTHMVPPARDPSRFGLTAWPRFLVRTAGLAALLVAGVASATHTAALGSPADSWSTLSGKRLAVATNLASAADGTSAKQQLPRVSHCLALAQDLRRYAPVRYGSTHALGAVRIANADAKSPPPLTNRQVRITFVTHATFRVETASGTVIATDFAGYAGRKMPTAVTMNHAHATHWTAFPDPAIKHVLRGWNPAGGAAKHSLDLGDVL
ncbi:MAG: MBL fold metallo-hydrolase, partial [Pseudomonadota bacterium]